MAAALESHDYFLNTIEVRPRCLERMSRSHVLSLIACAWRAMAGAHTQACCTARPLVEMTMGVTCDTVSAARSAVEIRRIYGGRDP